MTNNIPHFETEAEATEYLMNSEGDAAACTLPWSAPRQRLVYPSMADYYRDEA